MTARPLTEMPLGNQARKALAALQRWEKRSMDAAEQAELADRELRTIHRKACEKFGRKIPADAYLIDVLECIDIEDGDRWRWRGKHNNKDLGTIRIGRQELSLVRYLAIAFDVIKPDDYGMLYPADGDAEDVNPWHRTLRRSDRPVGNTTRWGFTLDEEPPL